MVAKALQFLVARPRLAAAIFAGVVILLATILHPDAASSAVLGAFGLLTAILGLGGLS